MRIARDAVGLTGVRSASHSPSVSLCSSSLFSSAVARPCKLRGFWAVLSGRRRSPFVCSLFNHGRCPRIYKLQTLPFEHVIVARDLCSFWFLYKFYNIKVIKKCIPARYSETRSMPFLGLTLRIKIYIYIYIIFLLGWHFNSVYDFPAGLTVECMNRNWIIKCRITLHSLYIYIYAFSRRFYPKRLTIAFRLNIFISTCVPWESNPQPLLYKLKILFLKLQNMFSQEQWVIFSLFCGLININLIDACQDVHFDSIL